MSKEYGTALFSLALESGQEQLFCDALDLVTESFLKNPSYMDFLSAPNIEKSARLAAISEAFSDSVPEQILSFLYVLCEHNRMHVLYDSAAEYKRLFAEKMQKHEAVVTSAVALNDKERAALVQSLEKKCGFSVSAEFLVDADILGGVVVEIDGNVYDGSLRQRLRDIKDVMQYE